MKTSIKIMALCGLLLMAAGCKDRNNPDNHNTQTTLKGNVSAPTWTVSADNDMTSSMTAVVKVDLSKRYAEQLTAENIENDKVVNEADLLAAFSGDECLGIAEQQDGLFYLYISAPADSQAASPISLRYYSAALSNIFVSEDTFPFSNDAQLGKVSAPYTPAFIIEKQ